jgi:hypothetical protein
MNQWKPTTKYPVYIPSKNRPQFCQTAKFFLEDDVDFRIVIEPGQVEAYRKFFDDGLLLVLPEDNLRLLGARLWIRQHSIDNGFDRHWQFDDNSMHLSRLHKGRRIKCNSAIALQVLEEFTDRYSNIGLSGFNYETFAQPETKKPFLLNHHIYSATLVNNRMPYKWRLMYNDDTDLCLQVLANGLCTVLFNAFCIKKIETMTLRGGNTTDLYQKDGRLVMARTLEEMWPEYVSTKWRFGRPQHVIKNNWRDFKQPLIRRTDIDWSTIENKTYEIRLQMLQEPKSQVLKDFYSMMNEQPSSNLRQT